MATVTPAKVALITASSAGLGAAIAKSLLPTHRIVINYHSNASRADSLMAALSSLAARSSSSSSNNVPVPTPRIHSIQADMSSRADIHRLVSETVSTMGRLDVVISNAGWTKVTDFADLEDNVDEDVWDRCWNVNVKSHLWLMHASKRFLEESSERRARTSGKDGDGDGNGVWISTASVAGVKPSGSSVPYAVTKAAQIHLMKCLAKIAAPKIRVNSISPGVLLTEWGLNFPPKRLEVAKKGTLLKRFATVEDVADQVRCLVESRSMTGQNIVIDSGFSM